MAAKTSLKNKRLRNGGCCDLFFLLVFYTAGKLRHKRTGRVSVETNIENERITIRELKQPRRRRQQERHKLAFFTIGSLRKHDVDGSENVV